MNQTIKQLFRGLRKDQWIIVRHNDLEIGAEIIDGKLSITSKCGTINSMKQVPNNVRWYSIVDLDLNI